MLTQKTFDFAQFVENPRSFPEVYEVIDGKPIFYSDQAMGDSMLQSMMKLALYDYFKSSLPSHLLPISGESGIVIRQGQVRSYDFAIYEKEPFMETLRTEGAHFVNAEQLVPRVVIEVDLQYPNQDVEGKIADILESGTEKLYWIFSSPMLVIEISAESRVFHNWSEAISICDVPFVAKEVFGELFADS